MSIGFSKPRAVALATVAGAITLGFTSGAFGTFSATLLSGYTCSAYGYFAGFGYGYNCTANSSSGGGGGGGSSSYAPPIVTTVTTTTSTGTSTPTVGTVVAIDGLPLRAPIATDLRRTKYATAMQTLIANGLMNNATKVYPTRPITRAEFMKILARANGFAPVTPTHRFADLSSSNDLAQYIYFGVAMGWVNTNNTNFRPNDPISQGEVSKLINAIKGTAKANTVVTQSPSITRAKAAQDIVDAFFGR